MGDNRYNISGRVLEYKQSAFQRIKVSDNNAQHAPAVFRVLPKVYINIYTSYYYDTVYKHTSIGLSRLVLVYYKSILLLRYLVYYEL